MSLNSPIEINLLGKPYKVSCKREEKEALIGAAVELNSRMLAIQKSGGVVGQERIAVMVALNLCHELQQTMRSSTPDPKRDAILARMAVSLDKALSDI